MLSQRELEQIKKSATLQKQGGNIISARLKEIEEQPKESHSLDWPEYSKWNDHNVWPRNTK